MTDLLLAVAHHLLVFTLLGILAVEFALLRPGLAGAALGRLQALDRSYGIVAGLVVIAGVLRVIYGAKGPDFYLASPGFWAKMAAFGAVALLSIPPTLKIAAWNRRLRDDADHAPPAAEIAAARGWIGRELAVFLLIPTFAAMMARGVGL